MPLSKVKLEKELSVEDIYLQTYCKNFVLPKALQTIIDENDPKFSKNYPFTKLKRKRYLEFHTDPSLRKPKKRKLSIKIKKLISRPNAIDILKAKLDKIEESSSED